MRGLALAAILLVAAALAVGAAGRSATSGGCGTGESATDRLPDAVAAQQIHVVYAIPSDGQDAFATDAPLIVADLAALDGWWERQDPTRVPRFDLSAFPGCDGGHRRARPLQRAAAARHRVVLPADRRAHRKAPCRPRPRPFTDPAKKYLVYYDAPVDIAVRLRSVGDRAGHGRRRRAYSFVYLQARRLHARPRCRQRRGRLRRRTSCSTTSARFPTGAPHICFEHSVCDWYWDVETQFPTGDPIAKLVLDYGRDDYYGHSGKLVRRAGLALALARRRAAESRCPSCLRAAAAARSRATCPGIACPGHVLDRLGARRPQSSCGRRRRRARGSCAGAEPARAPADCVADDGQGEDGDGDVRARDRVASP